MSKKSIECFVHQGDHLVHITTTGENKYNRKISESKAFEIVSAHIEEEGGRIINIAYTDMRPMTASTRFYLEVPAE